jgi:hypothetical protein
MPPIPSWLRHGRRTEYVGFLFLLFWRVFRAHLFREARSRKEIKALNAEVTGWTPLSTRVLHSLGASHEATVRFVCLGIWLFNFENEPFSLYFAFSLSCSLLRRVALVFLFFSGEFSSVFFSDLSLVVKAGSFV